VDNGSFCVKSLFLKKKMLNFSIIIPVFNRPDEVAELLDSLVLQTYKQFEVIVVEDGSSVTCKNVVDSFNNKLKINYIFKENTGPGTTRNIGAKNAKGDYLVFFDSDCIIPPRYLEEVNSQLDVRYTDAYGGPDCAHPSFTPLQKAINYSMTSFLTTGGIRGGKKKLDTFYPRSFNMGYSQKVFEKTQGFSAMRFGEDIDMSIRIISGGFSTQLIEKGFVYHKRRTDFKKFFKQVFNSGIARINLFIKYPVSLKFVHLMPAVFTIGCICCLLFCLLSAIFLIPFFIYAFAIWLDSSLKNKSTYIGLLSIPASYIQLIGYGLGFLQAFWKRIVLKEGEFKAFDKNFYK
jgi:glycosyltransferase involved in cell wall biosynthesis